MKNKKKEFFITLFIFVSIVFFGWFELKFIKKDAYVFLILFNLNVILLLVLLFLVIRNGVKLFLDRRKKVKGSKLRTKLVLSFALVSLVPTLLMLFFSIKFIQTSVDYWFQNQVDTTLNKALEAGRNFYNIIQLGLKKEGEFILSEIRRRRYLWGGHGMDRYLVKKAKEYDLSLIGVINPKLKEQNWHSSKEWDIKWKEIKKEINWKALEERPFFWSTYFCYDKFELILGILPVDKAKTGFLVLGKTIESGFFSNLNDIVKGVAQYRQLENLKRPLKIIFYMMLSIITLLILFGAMWFAFKLAKEISAPIQALSLGTQKIAHGELSVRLEESSGDELGMLVQSFNAMAEDLEKSQKKLSEMNKFLELQNKELEEKKRYIEAVLNNITAGVISLDRENKITTINKAAEEMLSLNSKRVIGQNPLMFLTGAYRELMEEILSRIKDGSSFRWEKQMEIPDKNGDRKVLINVISLNSEEGQPLGTILVFEDITEIDRMQRLAAWREVARRIAHEIKNPLTPIKLSAQRLKHKFGSKINDRAFIECTDVIIRQVEHLQALVREFSQFAKMPEIRPKDNILGPLLDEVITLFKNSHPNINWILEKDRKIPQFKFDRDAIKRVLVNLLTNSIEAMDGEKNPTICVKAYKNSDNVVLEVIDNGKGIKDRDKIFEPYYTAKKGNVGLGLTIVKSIIDDHKGKIEVLPNTPKGTIFKILLPTTL